MQTVQQLMMPLPTPENVPRYRVGDRPDAPIVVKTGARPWRGAIRCQVIAEGITEDWGCLTRWGVGTIINVRKGELREV